MKEIPMVAHSTYNYLYQSKSKWLYYIEENAKNLRLSA